MKASNGLIAAAIVAAWSGATMAAPSAEEIKQLGTTLTLWGAEKAGNKEGTIPEYTGGVTKPPAGWSKDRPGVRPDPYGDDKPLYRIDAKNMDQYADKLTPGVMEMMKKYPTFFIDVYPTRRTVAYPQHVLDNTVKNTTRCATVGDTGLDLTKGCGLGIPFPIPKNGLEVVWNHDARHIGGAYKVKYTGNYVKPDGEAVVTQQSIMQIENPWYDTRKESPDQVFLVRAEYFGPARIAGQSTMYYDMAADGERKSWSYQPATRRVRLAPDLAADTPIGITGGAIVYDEGTMFSGKKDRYDFKLVGKKEVFIPYNAYKFATPAKGSGCTVEEGKLTPKHTKPECMRWELHRVWHVQATLKPGKRHIYPKRDFFYDEDAWHGGLQENYDQAGRIYKVSFEALTPAYDILAPGISVSVTHDLVSGIYALSTAADGAVPTPMLRPDQTTGDSLSTHVLKY